MQKYIKVCGYKVTKYAREVFYTSVIFNITLCLLRHEITGGKNSEATSGVHKVATHTPHEEQCMHTHFSQRMNMNDDTHRKAGPDDWNI